MFIRGGEGNDWSVDECLLAISIYSRLDREPAASKQQIYRAVANFIGRSEAAVGRKVANVAACDSRDGAKPVRPLDHYQASLKATFDEYWPTKRDELEEILIAVISANEQGFGDIISRAGETIDPRALLIEEGRTQQISIQRRERSRTLTIAARNYYRSKDPYNELRCVVCGISFDAISGGAEIIHIHHLTPISQIDSIGGSTLMDVALQKVRPVCPNCHAIIHSRKPLLSIDEATAYRQHLRGEHR